jgi:CubicO group peptidase (beta-lactamase class C family)
LWVERLGSPPLFIRHGFSLLYKDPERFVEAPIRLRPDTLFDIASLTKLFTALGVALLIVQGKLSLDDRIECILGVQKAPEAIRVLHLLSHTSGLVSWTALFERPEILHDPWASLIKLRDGLPGKEARYSDIGYMLLGRIIEIATGMPLNAFLEVAILKPLEIHEAGFNPNFSKRPRISASEWQTHPPRGMVWGRVHDENAYALGGIAGHAGLFAKVQEIAAFGKSLMRLTQGPLVRARDLLWSPYRISTALSVQSLGFEKDKAFYMGKLAPLGALGHTGFTGTSLVLAPKEGLSLILLSYRVHPLRNRGKINDLREALADLVFEGLRQGWL